MEKLVSHFFLKMDNMLSTGELRFVGTDYIQTFIDFKPFVRQMKRSHLHVNVNYV